MARRRRLSSPLKLASRRRRGSAGQLVHQANRPGRLAAWPPGGPPAGAGYLGWTLVVVTGDPAARSGQVMVLDGAHPVDAAHPGFSVPLDGLLAGQVVRVHTVQGTGRGPRFSAFTQPLSASPAVSFPAAHAPYLVGVITAATPLVL
jgi:hypothetical protein